MTVVEANNPTWPTRTGTVGGGSVRLEQVDGQTRVTGLRCTNPLKLLAQPRREAAWIYTSGYGGGLVAGDHVTIDLHAGKDTTGVLTTQAATKVYHQHDGLHASQTFNATVDDGALLLSVPDPITCFADSDYRQLQTFEVTGSGSGLMVDWYTCGRLAFGERWAMARYESRTQVKLDGQWVLDDGTLLDGEIDSAYTVGRFDCIGLVAAVGPAVESVIERAENTPEATAFDPGGPVIAAVSRFDWGAAIRVMSDDVKSMRRWLADCMQPIAPRVGRPIWDRKW